MLSPKETPPAITDYGIAHANDFYTLCQLVKDQIKRGFQPCTTSGVRSMPHGEEIVFVQVMVKYAKIPAATAKKSPIKK